MVNRLTPSGMQRAVAAGASERASRCSSVSMPRKLRFTSVATLRPMWSSQIRMRTASYASRAMKTWRLQARNASGSASQSRKMASAVRIAPSWLYQVGVPIGRRKELMIGDIQSPQRRTWIMFSPSWTSPSLVKRVRIGVASFQK